MTIRINQLTFGDQIKFGMLSKEDQARVLNCRSINEAKALLNNMRESVRLDIGSYEPKLQEIPGYNPPPASAQEPESDL